MLCCAATILTLIAFTPDIRSQGAFCKNITASQATSSTITGTSPDGDVVTEVHTKSLTYAATCDNPQLVVGTTVDIYTAIDGTVMTASYSYQTVYNQSQSLVIGTVRYTVDANGNLVDPEEFAVQLPMQYWLGGLTIDRTWGNGWRNQITSSASATYIVGVVITDDPPQLVISVESEGIDYPLTPDGSPDVGYGDSMGTQSLSAAFVAPYANPQISTALDFCSGYFCVWINSSSVE